VDEALPVSRRRLSLALGGVWWRVAGCIVIVSGWLLQYGWGPAVAAGAGIVLLWAMFLPRALVIDEDGLRKPPLLPFGYRRCIRWDAIEGFHTKLGSRGQRAVVWSGPGIQSRRLLGPIYGPSFLGRALTARELCDFLNAELDAVKPRSDAEAFGELKTLDELPWLMRRSIGRQLRERGEDPEGALFRAPTRPRRTDV